MDMNNREFPVDDKWSCPESTITQVLDVIRQSISRVETAINLLL